jgi:hypothetical protein
MYCVSINIRTFILVHGAHDSSVGAVQEEHGGKAGHVIAGLE